MKTVSKISIISLLIQSAFTFCSGGTDSVKKQIISLEAEDISYSASEIHLKTNVPYRLKFRNRGNTVHDFNSEELPVKNLIIIPSEKAESGHSHHEKSSVHIAALSGESSSAEFTVSKPGTYEYYCTVPGHREAGMRGIAYVHE